MDFFKWIMNLKIKFNLRKCAFSHLLQTTVAFAIGFREALENEGESSPKMRTTKLGLYMYRPDQLYSISYLFASFLIRMFFMLSCCSGLNFWDDLHRSHVRLLITEVPVGFLYHHFHVPSTVQTGPRTRHFSRTW